MTKLEQNKNTKEDNTNKTKEDKVRSGASEEQASPTKHMACLVNSPILLYWASQIKTIQHLSCEINTAYQIVITPIKRSLNTYLSQENFNNRNKLQYIGMNKKIGKLHFIVKPRNDCILHKTS